MEQLAEFIHAAVEFKGGFGDHVPEEGNYLTVGFFGRSSTTFGGRIGFRDEELGVVGQGVKNGLVIIEVVKPEVGTRGGGLVDLVDLW